MEKPLTLLEEAVALALVGPKESGVRVMTRSDRDIIVDKIQIQQVALNLIRNEIETMTPASAAKLPTSTRIPLLIRGPASSADIADRLFQLFVATKSHGVRVRLSIFRTIIESHSSHIVVEATPSSSTILKTAFAELNEET
ncbi:MULTISPECIES: hypothetical protein [Bradyrhizobium]|uniref:hypothetical protein n=1 Tax=Bradyrhizobium TaxID=374 RepID=UPI001F1AD5B2|nr:MULTISPECIES: hypothetical protein [Bradyrhizobium]